MLDFFVDDGNLNREHRNLIVDAKASAIGLAMIRDDANGFMWNTMLVAGDFECQQNCSL